MSVSQEVYRKILGYLQQGNYREAERVCLFELGMLAKKDGRLLFLLGTAARMLHKNQAALVAFNAALSTDPYNIEYLQAGASVHEALGDYDAAYHLMLRVIEISPDNIHARANLAVALQRLNRTDEALAHYVAVLAVDPSQRTANLNYGTLLHHKQRKREALVHNRKAYARLPEVFGTLYNLVDTLIANFEYQEALDYCERGLVEQPEHAHLMMKKAIALSGLSKCDDALAMMSRARIVQPAVVQDYLPATKHLPPMISIYLDGEILEFEARYTEQLACYWHNRASFVEKLRAGATGKPYRSRALSGVENAFRLHSLNVAARDRLILLRNIADAIADYAWSYALPAFRFSDKPSGRIRIGYLSPDFREHATSILSRQVYWLHDRTRFDIYAYSLHNAEMPDRYRMEIESAVDVFRDTAGKSPADIATMIHQDQVDILVDLAGYTQFSNPAVMTMRPAPVQMLYLGFPGTMGADFIDYALIDRSICADGQQQEWHEQVIRLPHTLYPYDNETINAPVTFARADFGLSEHTFVFCCLNNSYKIEPRIFECWMNILKAVPDSVLWLLGKGLDVQGNLEREAEAHGVDKSRLVFTGRVPLEQHLPRYQLADLFLDTYWVNAHTTAIEALWQGLPLLTVAAEVASGRVAASVLHALEMPELVAQDFDAYERLAIFYATHPVEYAAMREKLCAKRYTAPMYNTKLTVKHVECAFRMAWERYQAGLPPAAFDVPQIDDPELRKSIH